MVLVSDKTLKDEKFLYAENNMIVFERLLCSSIIAMDLSNTFLFSVFKVLHYKVQSIPVTILTVLLFSFLLALNCISQKPH